MKKIINGLVFRLMEKRDIPKVLKLFQEMQPIIGGLRHISLYRALCNESLVDKRVVINICEDGSKIVAFRIAIIDRNRWRVSFICKHPLILIRMFLSRMNKNIKNYRHKTKKAQYFDPSIQEFLTEGETKRSWSDSSPEIAKVLFGGVTVSYRGKRIVKGIREHGDEILASRGVKRVDTIILSQNTSMIRATVRMGIKVYKQSDKSLLTTKDIK